MAENVQWIRLKVGMFDGNSFKKIKRAKIGGVSYRDKLTAVWFELLDLAGKSNANGYLIDNNEIPYQTFEDIATMLDREEKEIELCMQFFVSERMVEIIEDVYCLTNFVKYQNQEGLEKIREQKRIAQAKWRERKKQGLVGSVVESTQTSTSNLLSNSISTSTSLSNSISSIFEYWKTISNKPNIILTDKRTKAIQKSLKTYTEEEIKSCIDRYWKALRDERYFFDYEWDIDAFLTRQGGIAHFTEDGEKWKNYIKEIEKNPSISSNTHHSIANMDENDEFLNRILGGH